MNPLAVESSLVAALTPFFSGLTVSKGCDYATLTPESLNLVATVDRLDHVCGPLYTAEVSILLEGPATYGFAIFSSLEAAVEQIQAALSGADFAQAWPDGVPKFCGLWVADTTNVSNQDDWQVTVFLKVGVSWES